MLQSSPPPEAWDFGYIIDDENVHFDTTYAIPIRNRAGNFRPYGVFAKDGYIGLKAIDDAGNYIEHPLEAIPGVSSLAPEHLPDYDLPVIQSLIRPGLQSTSTIGNHQEHYIRLFAAPSTLTDDIPPAHFAIGRPPMYPDEIGLFMGAVSIGIMPRHLYEPHLFTPEERRLMYFPIITSLAELDPPQ